MIVLLRLATLLSGLFGVIVTGIGIYALLTLYKNSVFVSARALLAGVFALLTAFALAKQVRLRERWQATLSADAADAPSNSLLDNQMAAEDMSIWPNRVTWVVIIVLIIFSVIMTFATTNEWFEA